MIESTELKESLKRMLNNKEDIIERAFDRGIDTAIRVVELYEEKEGSAIAEALDPDYAEGDNDKSYQKFIRGQYAKKEKRNRR